MFNRGNKLRSKLANPGVLERLIKILSPWFCGAFIFSLIIGLWFAIINSPPDYLQGETVRIMYIHVPSAWMALFVYSSIAAASLIGLINGHIVAFIYAKSVAPIGAVFTLICLVTGSLWGKPMWGTWWVWDARLTSMFILMFIYLGYIIISKSFSDPVKGDKISSIFALIGFINIPIIKFSVDIWSTLHQTATISKIDTPSIHIDMIIPLLIMFISFVFLFLYIFSIRFFSELNLRRYVTYTLSIK
tara:strand:+ start:116 stop:853 length:738 start_codon:yes stop_codon:yes gene_type:complete